MLKFTLKYPTFTCNSSWTQYTNQWATGQRHQSLIRNSRYVTNPSTCFMLPGTQCTHHSLGSPIKIIFFTFYSHMI